MADKTKGKEIEESPKETEPITPTAETIASSSTPEGDAEKKEEKPEIAEEEEELNLGAAVAGISSWFTSTISSAKEKSSEMLQYLKQDFTEFSETVSEASTNLKDKLKLEDTARSAVQTVTSKASIVLDQMSTIFGVGPDDDDEAIVMPGTSSTPVDRLKAKIYSLAFEEDLFLKDPDDIKAYEAWLLTFDLEKKHSEMPELMGANPHLQLHYSQLVPEKVSHLVFWHRFYYRVHEICTADEEARRKQVTVSWKKSSPAGEKETNGGGGDHSPAGSDQSLVEISEDDQRRLLADYEEEMKNTSSAQHSRRSSGTQLSSSSSGSFAMVTHDATTDEVKIE